MNTKKAVVWVVIIAVTVVTLGIATLSSTRDFEIDNYSMSSEPTVINDEESFRSEGVRNINVRTVSEDINFITSDQQEIRVVFHGDTSNKKSAPDLVARQSGDTLELKVEHPRQVFGIFNLRQNFKLDIHIPEDYSGSINANTVSANVAIPELNLKSLYCKTISGNLTTDFISSDDMDFHTTSGNFKISGSCGNFSFNSISGDMSAGILNTKQSKFDTTSGKVRMDNFTGDLDFHSISGDLNVVYTEFANDISINTTSADTKIGLPENAEFYLNFRSTSGNIKTAFPVMVTESKKNSLEGTVVSDKNRITGISISGDFHIYK